MMSTAISTAIIAACAVFAAGLCSLVYWYAFRFEPVNFKVSNIKINIVKNAAGTGDNAGIFDNAAVPDFTILHLSDFHLRKDRKGEKLFEFVRSLWDYNPDFIFITGDLVEKDIYSDYLIKMLEGLNAKSGKYSVFGVHDYYNKSPAEFLKNIFKRKKEYRRKNDVSGLINKLGAIGIKVLRNERVSHILYPDFRINITGLEDSIIDKTDIAKAFGKNGKEDPKKEVFLKAGNFFDKAINKSLFVLNEEDSHNLNDSHKIEICLTHTPDRELFGSLSENGIDIVLAGHTHGGQVRLPGIGAIISGCNMKAKYASGFFYFKKFVLYVSRGLGEGRYSPFRFHCPPEATFIKVFFSKNFEKF